MQFPKRERKSGGRFLKVESGKPPIKGVFAGEPYAFHSHFLGLGKGSKVCEGDGCELCNAGVKVAERFKINFIVYEEGQYVAKIFEFNGFTYDDLSALHSAGYELDKNLFLISKSGSGQQTKVSVLPAPNGALTPGQVEGISLAHLNSLAPFVEKHADSLDSFVDFPSGE